MAPGPPGGGPLRRGRRPAPALALALVLAPSTPSAPSAAAASGRRAAGPRIAAAGQVAASPAPHHCESHAIELEAAPRCNCEACSAFGSTWLEGKCCHPALRGLGATLLAFERDPLWVPRLQEFGQCTGARVSITYNPSGEDGMEAALRQDVGIDYRVKDGAVRRQHGAGIYDGYVVQPPWLPAVASGLENLSPRIAESDGLKWLDINSMSRQIVSFNSSVRALPLDVDYVAIGWRQDVFEAHGRQPPETLEELVELSEYFSGKDHNGDGEPDWGFCVTPQPNYFMAFVAPLLQKTQRECRREGGATTCDGTHTGENIFFNISTFEPLVDNPAFRHAAELFRRLVRSSNCPEQLRPAGETPHAIGKCDRKAAFKTGRCAGVISMPNTLTQMLRPWDGGGDWAPQPRRGAGGEIVWEVKTVDGSHWGRRHRFPGSTKVFDPQTQSLKECDPELCPKAIPHPRTGKLVNYAPFFAEGGEAYAIRAAGSDRKKLLMWELFSWLGTLPATALPLSGFYRESQILEPDTGRELVQAGWPEQMVSDLFDLLHFNFLDPERGNQRGPPGNAAMDLILLGFSEYMQDLDRILIRGFLAAPGGLLGRREDAGGRPGGAFPEERYAEVARELVAAYDRRTEDYGRLLQITRWRESLNLPYTSPAVICRLLGPRTGSAECLKYRPADSDWTVALVLPLAAVALTTLFLLACQLVNKILSALRKKRELEKERQQRYRDTIRSAEEELGRLGYPMVLVQARIFLGLQKLVSYEELRDKGQLVFLDTLQKAMDFKQDHFIVFMSHQWLGWSAPDPGAVHYKTMCGAVRELVEGICHISSLSGMVADDQPLLQVTVDNLYVWCDYASIAQEHRPTQTLAIASLPVYSSIADIFVIVAPRARHADTGTPCDVDTYSSRGWCRAEMLSKVCGTGLKQMYIASTETGHLEHVNEAWLDRLDFKVFLGNFSCCILGHRDASVCDKQNLIKPVLGLYSLVLRQRHSSRAQAMLAYIEKCKEQFFPPEFAFESHRGPSEARELFGPLPDYMEEHVCQCTSPEMLRQRTPSGNSSSSTTCGTAATSRAAAGHGGSRETPRGTPHGAAEGAAGGDGGTWSSSSPVSFSSSSTSSSDPTITDLEAQTPN